MQEQLGREEQVAHDATLPAELRRAMDEHVARVHLRLEQDPPSAAELARVASAARAAAGGDDELRRLAAAGRLREVTGIRPFNLEMDIVNQCNLRCVMCMMSHPSLRSQTAKRFPLERFERLADEVFWHVNALSLTYGAEPLLHPEFARFLATAARYRVPRVYAVTNGLLLTESLARSLVEQRMHSLVVSVDAATPETYRRIRVGGSWDVLLSNLRMLQRVKRELGSQHPLLELAFVMMRSNVRELPQVIELAASLDVSAVYALHMVPFEPLHTERESCFSIKETTNSVLRAARATAARLGVNFTCPPEFGQSHATTASGEAKRRHGLPVTDGTAARGHCPFPWHFLAIDMRGDVIPCGWWQGGSPMGNIHREEFDAIWGNSAYRELRRQHREKRLCPTCQRCPAAGIGSADDPAAFVER